MAATTGTRLLPITTTALEQEVRHLLRKYARCSERVLLVRARLAGNGLTGFRVGDQQVRPVVAATPLAVLEQITEHLQTGGDDILVVLTPVEEETLGPGLLSHAVRQRVFAVEPWQVVRESFAAQHIDPRLSAEGWAGEALLQAMPPGGWQKLAGGLLTRDTALRVLTVQRLRLGRFRITPEDLDAGALLLWSRDLEAVEAFRTLRDAERGGLVRWLTETFHGPAQVLFALVEAGNAADALALGLVCGALWHPQAQAQRPQGAVLAFISAGLPGAADLSDDTIREFASECERLVRWMLTDRRDESAAHDAGTVLERAEQLLGQVGGQDAARHSLLLRSALDARTRAVGTALQHAVRDHHKVGLLADAIAGMRTHVLADTEPDRIRRAEMAQRLIQWLALGTEAVVGGVGSAVQSQIDQWGWVDRAADDVWVGDHVYEGPQTGFSQVYSLVRARRRALDRQFAQRLADWTADVTAAPSGPGVPLTVETVAARVLAPLVKARNGQRRPVLFLLLDGMSAAVATELAEQLRRARWEEYDPLGQSDDEPRRRSVIAALPTLTRYSRASLFAARITGGGQDDERAAFESLDLWSGHPVRLFHKSGLPGVAGETLGDELNQALDDEDTTVAVVLNSIDDSLDRGRESKPWTVRDVAWLQALLDRARSLGRAVVMTSDHGHVLEREGELRQATGAESARSREARGPAGDGEVLLAGPRVATHDGQTVALWDPALRYTAKKAGYHGGASLAEVAIPLLAFLPLGAAAPKGWRALTDQTPTWWSLEAVPAPDEEVHKPKPRARRTSGKTTGPVLFEVTEPATPPGSKASTLVAELMGGELFQAQQHLPPRKLHEDKIRAVLMALLDSGGVLPLPVIAQHAGEPAVRANGFAATLQRILNVDNYSVVSLIDNGRNVKLDRELLRRQFQLKGR